MPRRFDLIVFDWDGTLMDSTATIASSIQYSCRDLGLPVPTFEDASHVIGLGLTDALAYAVPQLSVEQMPAMVERYRYHYLSRERELVLFPEVPSMLSELRQAGHLLAVATGKNRNGLDRALRNFTLLDQFDATRTADESRSKPDPQMLLDLMKKLGTPAERVLMIGDTTHDLKMANNAATAGLGVAYGAHPAHALAGEAPLGVVASSVELRAWLSQHA